jgi:hypothetical protein
MTVLPQGVVDSLGELAADAGDFGEFFYTGAADFLEAAEVLE